MSKKQPKVRLELRHSGYWMEIFEVLADGGKKYLVSMCAAEFIRVTGFEVTPGFSKTATITIREVKS